MRIVIVHYHLKPGGVTRVIEQTVRVLHEVGVEVLVLSGEAYTGPEPMPVSVVPTLRYAGQGGGAAPESLARTLREAALHYFEAEPDVWHIHNHALGKNYALPGAVNRIAHYYPVLLQLHDFAEDGRPNNYKAMAMKALLPKLYPVGSHVHYALLNGRDSDNLMSAGLPAKHTHVLSNPVASLPVDANAPEVKALMGRRLFLYPTRGIRRKNLGEFLLWSAMAEPDDLFATTLIPANPTELEHHERWVRFAESLQLPTSFGLGQRIDAGFADIMQCAYAVVSTSIAEGFGMAFLEPWLLGKILVGRDLPDITRDFAEQDLNLSHLYPRLEVPLKWVGEDIFRKTLQKALIRYFWAYGRELPPEAEARAWAATVVEGQVEFGALDDVMQRAVISKLKRDPKCRDAMEPKHLEMPMLIDTLQKNAEVVQRAYSPEGYGDRLIGIYENLLASTVGPLTYLDPEAVLSAFLSPEHFRLLRT